MSIATFRGGAKIGWVGASWPFGRLTVEMDRLTLKCLGTYSLASSEVIALEPYGGVPFFANGIRIRHNRADYPETLIFMCVGSRKSVLDTITAKGFSPKGAVTPRAPGIPIHWTAILCFSVIWNVLFLMDQPNLGASPPSTPGPFSVLALFLAFAFCTATRVLPAAQRLVLREGHQFGEIKEFFALMQIVTGGLFVGFSIALLASYAG